jgi:hypothetical protein
MIFRRGVRSMGGVGVSARAVKEYIAGLDMEPNPDRKAPNVISLSDPGLGLDCEGQ